MKKKTVTGASQNAEDSGVGCLFICTALALMISAGASGGTVVVLLLPLFILYLIQRAL